MPNHTVHQGECLSSIAKRYGFADPKVIWDHASNQGIKEKRHGDSNVLFPGDVLFIPDRGAKKVEKKSGGAHTFKAKAPTKKLHLILKDSRDQPLAGKSYTLEMGSETLKGTTDGAGVLDREIPPDVKSAKLTVDKYHWDLDIGHLNPVLEAPDEGYSGIVERLKNLGYMGEQAAQSTIARIKTAVERFQEEHSLPATGKADPPTKQKIEQAHKGEATPQKKPAAPPPVAGNPKVKVVDSLPETPALCSTLAKQKKKKPPANAVAPTTPNVLKPARKASCALCEKHEDCLDNDYNFLLAVAEMSARLDGDATGFMGIMHFETGHSYSSSIKNKGSGATGLIQFMPSTAKGLGTTTETLGKMCRIEQLGYAEKYFKGQKRSYPKADYKTVRDVVLAVFEPIGLDPDHDILGVSASVCKGPFFDDAESGRVEVSDGMIAYFKAHKKDAKGKNVIKQDGAIIGVNGKKTYYTAKKGDRDVRVTGHQRDVYRGNSGLDKDKDGFLMRDDYPGIVDGLIKGCSKEACEKAHALQGQLPKDYEILTPGAPPKK